MNIVSLSLEQVLELHAEGIRRYGGRAGVRDIGLIDSALAQPWASFGGTEFHPTLAEKAAVLGFSLVKNHGFIDGNKRVGFAAMDVFARVNGFRVVADTDDAEQAILAIASGQWTVQQFTEWVRGHLRPLPR